ncbi:MAG: beta-propeller fold lactonase family protein, partial [Deltaproteobacteria bacterium]|nr:beta-propeller fold lactonase family protein [Deltaproteobacteria bacterium]
WKLLKTIDITVPLLRKEEIAPKEIELTPDGKYAFVALGSAKHVAVIDRSTYTVVTSILVGARPWGMALTPDGKKLYVANGSSNDVTVIDVEKLRAVKTMRTGRYPWTVAAEH